MRSPKKYLIILISFLCLASLTGLAHNNNAVSGVIQGRESVLFSDDFESYSVGSFPSQGGWKIVWDGAGSEYQKVIIAKEVLGFDDGHGKVLHLLGVRGWSSVVKRSFTTNSRYIGYEFDILILDRGEGYRDHPGFFCEGCRTWGAYWATVEFSHKDGKTYAKDGTVLGSWTPGRWYHVKVILDKETDRYDVYIDGQLKGHDLQARGSDDPSSQNIESLALVSAWPAKPVLYDNVKVFTIEERTSTCEGDIWTNKGGQGHNVGGGTFEPYEDMTFYFNISCSGYVKLEFEGPNPTTLDLGYLQGGRTYQITGYFEEEDVGHWLIHLMQKPEGSSKWIEIDQVSLDVISSCPAGEYDVKFRGIIEKIWDKHHIDVKITDVISDPSNLLNIGGTVLVTIPENPTECGGPGHIDEVSIGDQVEVYARFIAGCVWFILIECDYHYLIKILPEETVTTTSTITTTIYETTTSTVYRGDTTWTTVTKYVAETVYRTVESWTTTTITHYTTKTYTTTITTTITQSTGITILCIGILAVLGKIYRRWKRNE